MTNDPYRDEPYGLGGPQSGAGPEQPPERPRPPEPGTPGADVPPPTWPPPSATPMGPGPTEPYQSPQYQGPQYQSPQYQGAPYQGPPAPGQPYPGAQRPTNGLAIAALVCSIAGVVTLISAPVGAVLGHLATRQIAQTGEEGAPLAKAAIWIGWIITGLVVVACCAVLATALAASRTSTDFGPR